MGDVAYASAGGFAAVRTFDKTRTERRREEREAARAEQRRETLERNAFRRSAPAHCRALEPFEREWFVACDRAFKDAMEAAGYQRSTGKTQLNGAGSTR